MANEFVEGCEDCRREAESNPVKRLYGIWCFDENSWLRELPSTVDDGGIALLVLPTKKSACERAAKHYGYESYREAKKEGWCEVRAFTVHHVVTV